MITAATREQGVDVHLRVTMVTVLTFAEIPLLESHKDFEVDNRICLSDKTTHSTNEIHHHTLLRNNRVHGKAALFVGLQTAHSPQGHYPAQEMRKWAPDVTGKPFAQNAGLNQEGGGGRAMLDQSSDMFTLQLRIFLRARPSCWSSQAPKLRSAEKRHKHSLFLLFSSLPPSPVLWGPSQSSTPFASF